jgi:hypothetical protein
MEACDCSALARRCERCIQATIAQLSGVAQSRGWEHAPVIAGAPIGGKWRTSRERAIEKARRFVEDISSGDERLIAAFAELACKGAARRWRSGI